MQFRRLLYLLPLVVALPAGAQETAAVPALRSFGSLSAAYAGAAPKGGVSFTGGFGLATRRLFGYLVPVDITIIPGEQGDRYYMSQLSNSQDRCRDSQKGQFADTDLCRTTPSYNKYAATVETHVAPGGVTNSLFFGGGYRAGFAATPYGTLGWIGGASAVGEGYAPVSAGSGFWQVAIGGHWRR